MDTSPWSAYTADMRVSRLQFAGPGLASFNDPEPTTEHGRNGNVRRANPCWQS